MVHETGRKRVAAKLTQELWDQIGKLDEWRDDLCKALVLVSDSFEERDKDLTIEARDRLIERANNLLRLLSRFADLRDTMMTSIADNPDIETTIFRNTWWIYMKDMQERANATLRWSKIDYWPGSKQSIMDIMEGIQSLEE